MLLEAISRTFEEDQRHPITGDAGQFEKKMKQEERRLSAPHPPLVRPRAAPNSKLSRSSPALIRPSVRPRRPSGLGPAFIRGRTLHNLE